MILYLGKQLWPTARYQLSIFLGLTEKQNLRYDEGDRLGGTGEEKIM
jgi:hypothetical protein